MIRLVRRMIEGPSPEQLAARELAQARRELLRAQTAREYAGMMCAYHARRITRLRAFLADSRP